MICKYSYCGSTFEPHDRRQLYCTRKCKQKAASAKWVKKVRITQPARYKTWLNKRVELHRKQVYDLAPGEFESTLEKQNNRCGLCGVEFDYSGRCNFMPVVDHNHITNQRRDIIHASCNRALGFLQESAEVCQKAADYLRRHDG